MAQITMPPPAVIGGVPQGGQQVELPSVDEQERLAREVLTMDAAIDAIESERLRLVEARRSTLSALLTRRVEIALWSIS